MPYVLMCEDRPDGQALRRATRQEHLAYVGTRADLITLAGPLLADDGERMIGSLFILNVEHREQVDEFHQRDPYTRAGLWERVIVHPFRQVIPEP